MAPSTHEKGRTMMVARSGSSDPALGTLLPLNQAADPAVAGRKAASLATLKALGFQIPGGWVIPVGVAQQIATGELPSDITDQLRSLPDTPMAVRSSGVAEDGDEVSLAGQYESLLNVQGVDALIEAARAVWLSGQRLTASTRQALGAEPLDSTTVPTAILIQPMLRPDAAGVAFSANPVTGDRSEVVINAVAGLGDRLMAGEIDPETWLVHEGSIARDTSDREILDEAQARRIAMLAREVEASFGKPQDIEWAIVGEDLYLLQARPITALPVQPDLPPPPPGPWIKETEHYRGIVSVALASVHGPTMEAGTRQAAQDLGLPFDCTRHIDRAGELYMQDTPLDDLDGDQSEAMAPFEAILNRTVEVMNQDIFGTWANEWRAEWKDELRTRAEQLNAVTLTDLSDHELADHFGMIWELLTWGRVVHMRLAIGAAYAPYELYLTCRDLFGWDDAQAMTLVAATASASSAPTRAIQNLIEIVRERPNLANLVREPDATLERIATVDPDFANRIDQYRDEFGHRPLENDFAVPTLYERPDLILGLIRDNLDVNDAAGGLSAEARQQQQREEAERLLRDRSSSERRRYEQTLQRAAEFNSIREAKVIYTIYYPLALTRYAFLEAGNRLVRRGLLNRVDDVFYLGFDELVDILRGCEMNDTKGAVRQRRAERAWTAAHPGPTVLGEAPEFPDMNLFPEPARTLLESFIWYEDRRPDAGPSADGRKLVGGGVSAGRYRGPVRLIHGQEDFARLKPGDVLVCPVTTSAWGVLFGTASALVTDHGGVLSHPSIAAREHGIPAVVGTLEATSLLKDGQMVTVDGSTGVVEVEARDMKGEDNSRVAGRLGH